ncbi:unnamed protein product [Adineta steineri]|uniref:Stress-response A/B barrel domain-containing protein n=1 Tax=Adineta steineri TaxID=433720 RepID=A0A819CBB4_9BILA|nr:unnamed protein product [Adineta steineri]CAF3809022.1 unnamed protein product [Adineta steineri]
MAQNCVVTGCQLPDSPCCSRYGFCGGTAEHCDPAHGCQSGCWPASNKTKLYHHCITFRYRPEVTQAQIDSVTKAYIDVGNKALINGKKYVKIAGGRTISTEGIESNFRNGFVLTFTSAADRFHFICCEKAHQDFGNFMGQYVTQTGYNVGFDFEEEISA